MKVLLGFHYRPEPTGMRAEIFKRTRPIIEDIFAWDDVCVMDSGHPVYNRAASRNLIVKKALDENYDVVVIHDADGIATSYVDAIRTALDRDVICNPFDKVHFIGAGAFFPNPTKYKRFKPFYEHGPSFGGIYVCQPEVWATAGWMDERIEGWGFEDQILLSAAITYLGGPVHIPGILYNVNHARTFESLHNENNKNLLERYHDAEGEPDGFREVQRHSNGYIDG